MSLTVSPPDKLQFKIQQADSTNTPKCVMSLSNETDENLAFKVKTTQPRRYLVRPNQGIIPPGGSSPITIILVAAHVTQILNDYIAIGPSALSSNKDKFLVQSYVLDDGGEFSELAEKVSGLGSKESAEELTVLWKNIGDNKKTDVVNKKLHVEHVVEGGGGGNASQSQGGEESVGSAQGYGAVQQGEDTIKEKAMQAVGASSTNNKSSNNNNNINNNNNGNTSSVDFQEVSLLRKKYDELVQFSVNLTAERDFLNNSLEQAKRDLNREMAARMSAEDSAVRGGAAGEGLRQRKGGGGSGGAAGSAGGAEEGGLLKGNMTVGKKGFTFFQLLIIAIVMFLAGKYIGA